MQKVVGSSPIIRSSSESSTVQFKETVELRASWPAPSEPIAVGMLIRRLRGFAGRFLGDRRAVLALSAVGLAATLLVAVFAKDSQAVGSAMFLPWVALLGFEFGVTAGSAAAVVAFALFLVPASEQGSTLTLAFVVGRLASFLLIGAGVGILGTRLRASEIKNRRLVEGLPLAVYVESEQQGLSYVGPQIESIIGYPRAAWLGPESLWRRILHDEDREQVIAAYSAAVAARAPFSYEYRLIGPDGRTIWVRDSSTLVDDAERSDRQGFIVDITQLKQAEKQLERNATLLRGLIDATVDGICLTDKEGEILIANRPMRRLVDGLGIVQEGPIHERLLAIAERTTQPERYARRIRDLAADPFTPSFDEFELARDGRDLQGFTAPVVSGDDEYLGRVWTLREVTEQRQLDRLRDTLIATVSHELRTPLTSIIGYLELLGTGPDELGAEDAGYIEVVARNAVRLQRMVEDLLFFAQLDAGGFSLELSDADLVELAGDAIRAARPAAAAKNLILTLEHDHPTVVRADSSRMGQALDNLISNAIKFTPEGGKVRLLIENRDADCLLQVADTGYGIPASEQPRLFERFFRSTNATANHVPGTGLGLTIAKTIVEGHGGSISFDSTDGKGTTFSICLPKPTVVHANQPRLDEPLPNAAEPVTRG
jgi:PAS domain S-box-containing protein